MSGDGKTAELKRIYKCDVCGNIVEVLHSGVGQLVCCGQPMRLVAEVEGGSAAENHVPIVDYGEKITVKVGSVPHPMEEKHYIEWIGSKQMMLHTGNTCSLAPSLKPNLS